LPGRDQIRQKQKVKKEEEKIIVVLLGLNDWRVGDQGLGDGVVGVETDGRVELV
jgi:hypothetical protein